jgi:hypothetical protein
MRCYIFNRKNNQGAAGDDSIDFISMLSLICRGTRTATARDASSCSQLLIHTRLNRKHDLPKFDRTCCTNARACSLLFLLSQLYKNRFFHSI